MRGRCHGHRHRVRGPAPDRRRSAASAGPTGRGTSAAGATVGGPPRRVAARCPAVDHGRSVRPRRRDRWPAGATMAGCSRCGRRPCRSIGTWPVRRSGATPTSMWRSSAPASRACGPRLSLAQRDPALRIAVLERHTVGFGASGCNGGWCSALLTTSLTSLAAEHRRDAAVAAQQAMHAAVDEVGRFAAGARDDAGFHKGGTVTFARTPAQHARLAAEVDEARAFGFGSPDLRWMTDDELAVVGRPPGTLAALMTPHCAAVHPLRLVHAIAGAAQAAGVRLHTGTSVTAVEPGRVTTPAGVVRAEVIVLATEAWTAQDPDRRREVGPRLLADGRVRSADAGPMGRRRARRPADVPRRPPHDHLRPAHRRRPHRLRRPRGALPLRLADRARLRHRRRRARPSDLDGARALPHPRRRRVPVPLGRSARRAAGPATDGALRPHDRDRRRRRLRR